MESVITKGLVIGSYIQRNDPREALLSTKYNSFKDLKNKIVGSSSRRRELQIKSINKDVIVKNIRGNIDTRVKKMGGAFGAEMFKSLPNQTLSKNSGCSGKVDNGMRNRK